MLLFDASIETRVQTPGARAPRYARGGMLICGYCGSANEDPGGDPRNFFCGVCGHRRLYRVQRAPQHRAGPPLGADFGAEGMGLAPPPNLVPRSPENRNSSQAAGAVVGVATGAALGGPVGAIVGGIIGWALGGASARRTP